MENGKGGIISLIFEVIVVIALIRRII